MKPWDKRSVNADGTPKIITRVKILADGMGNTKIVKEEVPARDFPQRDRDVAHFMEGARDLMRIMDGAMRDFNAFKGKHIAFGAAERQEIARYIREARMIWTAWHDDLPSIGYRLSGEIDEKCRQSQQVEMLFDYIIAALSSMESSYILAAYEVPRYLEDGVNEAIHVREGLHFMMDHLRNTTEPDEGVDESDEESEDER